MEKQEGLLGVGGRCWLLHTHRQHCLQGEEEAEGQAQALVETHKRRPEGALQSTQPLGALSGTDRQDTGGREREPCA